MPLQRRGEGFASEVLQPERKIDPQLPAYVLEYRPETKCVEGKTERKHQVLCPTCQVGHGNGKIFQ